jgi:hypothetical protein
MLVGQVNKTRDGAGFDPASLFSVGSQRLPTGGKASAG